MVLTLPCLLSARAGERHVIPTDPSSGISVIAERWCTEPPAYGYIAVKLDIDNASQSEGQWTIDGQKNYGQAMTFSHSVRLGGGKRESFEVVLPVTTRSIYGWTTGAAHVGGTGVTGGMIHWSSSTGGRSVPLVAVSSSLSADTKNSLMNGIKTEVSMASAPTDWRGYLGFESVCLTETDWKSLNPAAKSALLDWTAFGGLVLVGLDDVESSVLEGFGEPRTGNQIRFRERRHGLGAAMALRATVLDHGRSLYSQYEAGPPSGGLPDLANLLGPLKLGGPFIFGFIALFSVVIGPLNLFWLAPASRRHRLFWTIPLIALVGSGALALLIIVQDGFGGTGARVVFAQMLPEEKKLAITQEQASKTGLLLGGGFTLDDPAWVHPVEMGRSRNDSRTFHQAGGNYSGDWFESRSIQGQVLQAVRPSRGAIEFISGNPPSVVSSLETELSEVYVLDESGQAWRAEDLGVGEKKSMIQVKNIPEPPWAKQGDSSFRRCLDRSRDRKGWAYAVAKDPAKLAIPTLKSIRWKHDHAYIAGPYVKRS